MRRCGGARVLGSVLGATAMLAVLAGGAMAGGDPTLKVTSNTLLSADWIGSVVIARDGVTLDCDGHRIVGSGTGRGVLVDGRTGVTVRNCDVSNFATGFFVANASASTFEANRSHDNQAGRKTPGWIAGAGFWVQNSSGLTLAGNVIYDNASDGLDLLNSFGNTLSFNATSDNLAGFFIFGARSANNTLDGNSAEGNEYAGFVLAEGASNATLTGNVAGSNVGAGFLLDGSTHNTLLSNVAGSNRVGFAIANGSSLNTLQTNSACGNIDIDAFQDATSNGNMFIGNSFCTSSGI